MLFNEERGSRKTNSDGLLPLLREREGEKKILVRNGFDILCRQCREIEAKE